MIPETEYLKGLRLKWCANYFNNSRCQFINSGACLSQSRARSPSVALLAMSVGSMPSLCACASRIFSSSRKRRNSASLGRRNLCRKISGCLLGRNCEPGLDGFQQSFAAARGHLGRQDVIERLLRGGGLGDIHHAFVTQDKKRRTAISDGFFLAPLPKLAQNGEGRAVQDGTALHAPNGIGVHDLRLRTFFNQARTGFLMPREAAFGFERGF
jgi:hypothetical protein